MLALLAVTINLSILAEVLGLRKYVLAVLFCSWYTKLRGGYLQKAIIMVHAVEIHPLNLG